ncbi:MAG TPA: choice-of-anchor D domain-containing protein, partial [Bacteroidota bacterium]|nr:choice-of-anchor D domain-containing protein [Bacteroidota bacterium]
MKSTIAFALLILLSVQSFSQSLNLVEPSARRKVDPLLQQSLLSRERFPDQAVTAIEYHAAGTRAAQEMGDMVGVLIESSSDITPYVRSKGGIVGSKHGTIYTALLPTTAVGGVAQQSSVRYIEASRPMFSSLDLSVAKTGADVLHSFADTTKRLTGKGVIIGFTDTGINTDHPNFKLPDGRTRILYVWDQYSAGTPPAGFTYGIEKDSAAINAHTWSMYDYGYHGTHVAGIAAGNGMPSKEYVGMAPDADIIMVSNFGDDLFNRGLTTVGTLDGYDYIRAKANALGKRFVINTSQGTNLGPHDGTTLFEQAVNADVAAGGILALAAGNEATSSRHASAVITTSTPQEVECTISGSGFTAPMDIWYEKNDRVVLRIKEEDDADYVTLFPAVDSTIVYAFDWAVVSVTTTIGSPLNGDNQIYITFRAFASLNMKLEFSAAPGNSLPDGGRVDLWWERNYPVQFLTNVDQSITFGIPAGADSAITVASYNNRSGSGSVDDISSFSGIGPRRDGILKPDISGLGGMVMSSVPGGYDMFSGTSMSSPHVAGAAALLLQQDTGLTSSEVKQKLLTSATSDPFTGPVPNPIWGYGKLNVLKAAGYPGIAIIEPDRDTLNFESALVQLTKRDSLIIRNHGSGDLTITSVIPSSGIFSVDNPTFTIGPRSLAKLYVNVTPTDTGSFSGYVDIASNDSSQLTARITLLGRGDYVPVAGASPDSIMATLNEGEHLTRTLTIANTGQGPLRYEIGIDYLPESVPGRQPTAVSASTTWAPRPEQSAMTSSVTPLFAATSLLPVVIKDPIGDGSGVDISEVRGIVEGGMVKVQFVLASEFNPDDFAGYLGLDIDQNAATGTPLPYGNVDQDVGCEFRLEFFNLSSGVRLYDSFGSFVGIFIPTFDLPGNSFTFSIPLDLLNNDDGTMNIAGVLGTSSGPTDWVPDAGHGTIGISWLSASPSEGTIPPGGSMPVSVLINTDYMSSGSFSARLVVGTNDPDKKTIEVPVHAAVTGAPNLFVADSINFGTVYVGYPDTIRVEISNNGSFSLTVTSMTINDSRFSVLDATSFTLLKDSARTIRFRCDPAESGNLSAELSIASNDAGTPVTTVPMTAAAVHPPLMTLTPDSVFATVDQGDTVSQIVAIGNSGLGELRWKVPGAAGDSLQLSMIRTEAEREAIRFQQSIQNGNNTGTATIASYSLNTLLSGAGTRQVLLWTGFSDNNTGGEVENTMNAIRQFVPDATFDTTQTSNPVTFSGRLQLADIFIMPEQELISDLFSLGGAFGPALQLFVQGGGTFIVMDYYGTGSTSFLAGSGLLDISITGSGEFMVMIHDSLSELVEDLPDTFFSMNGSNYHFSNAGKKIVKEVSSGNNVVTLRTLGTGRVVYIGMDFYSYNNDMARVLANAVLSSRGRLVSLSPSSGVVSPGGSQDVTVTLNAALVRAGTHQSAISLANNDPLRNPKILFAQLYVVGKPIFAFDPDSLAGILAYVGVARTDTLIVRNDGSEQLSVSSVVPSDTTVTVNKTSFTVAAESLTTLVITTKADGPGGFRKTITLATNDTKNPAPAFVVSGTAVHPPVLTTAPDSFAVAIDEGDTIVRTLTIGNNGLGELQWRIKGAQSAIAGGSEEEASVLSSAGSAQHPNRDWVNNFTVTSISGASGAATRLVPRNPIFAGLADSEGVSVAVFGDENVGSVVSFLQAHSYNAVAVSTSDILGGLLEDFDVLVMVHKYSGTEPGVQEAVESFVSAGGGLITEWSSTALLFSEVGPSPYAIPTPQWQWYAGVADRGDYVDFDTPIDIVDHTSPLVENLTDPFSGGAATEFFFTVSGYPSDLNVVAQYAGHGGVWPALMTGLYGTGTVVMHFFDSADDLTEPSIQQLWINSIQVALEGLGWAYADTTAGTLQAEQSTDLTLTFSAAHFPGGQYQKSLTIISNDPLRNPKDIPVTLNVTGKPFIKVLPDSVKDVIAYEDVPRIDTILVKNTGSVTLSVSNVAASDTSFKVDRTSFTVAADTVAIVVLTTTRPDTGHFRGEITFSTNDEKNPTVTFVVEGRALYRPVLGVFPDSLFFILAEGETESQTITIQNDGLGVLNWDYSAPMTSANGDKRGFEALFAPGSLWRPWNGSSEKAPSVITNQYRSTASAVQPFVATGGGIASTILFFPLYGISSTGIREIDPRTGTVINEFPMSFSGGPDGIAFDGTWLYVLPGYTEKIYKVSPVTGGKADSIIVSGEVNYDGLATDGSLLYLLNYNTGTISALDIASKSVVAVLTPGIPLGGGMTYCASRRSLFVSNFTQGIYELDAVTGSVIRSFPSPQGVNVYGVAYSVSADLLIVSGNGLTFLLDPDTGEIEGSFEGWYSGLAADESGVRFAFEPHSGSLNPGNSQEVSVSAMAQSIPPGDYRYSLLIHSNDPLNSKKKVLAAVQIAGRPIISVSPDTVKYGTAYVGITRKDTIVVKNVGSVTLQISAVTPSDPMFHPDTSSFTLAAHAQRKLVVGFTPTATGPFSGLITIASTDTGRPSVTVPLYGTTVQPAIITVAPDSLNFTLKDADSLMSTMTMSNGGLGELLWEIPGASAMSTTNSTLNARTDEERAVIQQEQMGRKGTNDGTPTVGPFSIDAMLASAGTTRILLWTGFADTTEGGEVENTMNAIRQYRPDVVFEKTSTNNPVEFATRLGAADIFIMPEQEMMSDLASLGTSFLPALTSFVQSGKTMIVLDYYAMGSTSFLNATGLLSVNVQNSGQFTVVPDDPTSPLVKDLPPSFLAMDGANYHSSTNGKRIIRDLASNLNVVTQRNVGAGRVIYFGMDYYSYNSSMARLLGNAVSSSRGSFVTFSPSSGVITPGGSQEIAVKFNAKGLPGGTYGTSVTIYNNDPLRSRK